MAGAVSALAAAVSVAQPAAHPSRAPVVVVRAEPVVVAGKFTVLPAPLTQRHTYSDLTEWFASAPDPYGLPRIGLAHGCVQGILPGEIDSANPIAAGRAAEAGLTYLALGDWHGTKRIDERTWYAGTPESDRFKDNDSGNALWVTIETAHGLPRVEKLRTTGFAWHQVEATLAVESDVDGLVRALESAGRTDVLQVCVSGICSLAGHDRLLHALGATQAAARAVIWDAAELRLEPTEEDIHALHADGFVGEALQELRAQQGGSDAELARDAILALARILNAQRNTSGVPA